MVTVLGSMVMPLMPWTALNASMVSAVTVIFLPFSLIPSTSRNSGWVLSSAVMATVFSSMVIPWISRSFGRASSVAVMVTVFGSMVMPSRLMSCFSSSSIFLLL